MCGSAISAHYQKAVGLNPLLGRVISGGLLSKTLNPSCSKEWLTLISLLYVALHGWMDR